MNETQTKPRVVDNRGKATGSSKKKQADEALAVTQGETIPTSSHFVIVKRSEYHVALRDPVPDVISTRNSKDRFTVTGFFIHSWHDSSRPREISTQARKQRRVGVPYEHITTIRTDDERVKRALAAALKEIGV